MRKNDWSAATRKALEVLSRHDGVAKLDHFRGADLTEFQVSALRQLGVLERPRNGWYVDPELPWQAKHAIRVGGILSCISACDSFGIPVPVDLARRLHVLLPGNAPRVRHHRDRRHYVVPGEDREVVRHWSAADGTLPGWRTPLAESLVALVDCVPPDWWIAALDAALHRPRDGEPLLSAAEFRRLRELLSPSSRAELRRVNPVAESCLETLLRLAMQRRGIVGVVCQFETSPRYRADFLIGRDLLVEADGEEWHDEERDRIRDAFHAGLGYRTLRFRYDDIVGRIEWVLDQIEAAMLAAGSLVL